MRSYLMISVLLFAGCTTMTKPGVTPETKAKDRYECEHEVLDTRHAGPFEQNILYRDCMLARGYS